MVIQKNFEFWIKEKFNYKQENLTKNNSKKYTNPIVQNYWEIWQASVLRLNNDNFESWAKDWGLLDGHFLKNKENEYINATTKKYYYVWNEAKKK